MGTGLVFSSTYPGALTICAPPARLPYDLEIKEEWCSVYLHHGRRRQPTTCRTIKVGFAKQVYIYGATKNVFDTNLSNWETTVPPNHTCTVHGGEGVTFG